MIDPVLTDVLVVLVLATVVLVVFHRLRVPTVLGFLATGVVAGPSGLGLVRMGHEVEALAEVGVVLLLFTIGLELSVADLKRMRRAAAGGALQVALTAGGAAGVAAALGIGPRAAVFLGFVVALSSTAVVLKVLEERGEMDAPHGRAALGILVVQDLAVAPMILAVPLLAGQAARAFELRTALTTAGLLALLVVACWALPRLLDLVVRTRDRELFVIGVVGACLAVAWITYQAHLSLALGAFLAGFSISSSPYGRHALASMLPLRHVFTSFFFISVGMLLDVGFAAAHWYTVLPVTAAVILGKALVVFAILAALGASVRTVARTGLALAQVGEFSFLLLARGRAEGLLDPALHQTALAVSLLSMGVTPFLIAAGPRVGRGAVRLFPGAADRPPDAPAAARLGDSLRDHVVIVGYGIVGRNVARAARGAGIPHVVVELNAHTVKEARGRGEPVFYGDAIHERVLEAFRVDRARVVVVAIADPASIRTVTAAVRKLNAQAELIVRTRYVQEMDPLRRLGADQVIPEEFETSVEIFTRVLHGYRVPRGEVEAVTAEIRAEGYRMFLPPDEEEAAGPAVRGEEGEPGP